MPVDPGQPRAALTSLPETGEQSEAAEETRAAPAEDDMAGDAETADRIEEAVAEAAEIAEETGGLGELGRPVSRRSPFFIGMAAAAGVAVTYGLVELTIRARSVLTVMVVYFLFSMDRIRLFAYRLAPHSRRTRVILIGDETFTKVGGYVLGNFLTSVIAGLGTYIWLLIFGVPYPILPALTVALFDLIPVIGAYLGGAVVSLVALTVSLPVAVATLGFCVVYTWPRTISSSPGSWARPFRCPRWCRWSPCCSVAR